MPTDNKNTSKSPSTDNKNELKHSDPNFSIKRGGTDIRIDSNDATIEQIKRILGEKSGNNNSK